MIIPLWTISTAFILCYIGSCLYFTGILFYILTKNKLGIFSENPRLWALLICFGGPVSYFIFYYIIMASFLQYKEYKFCIHNKWKFPNISNTYIQECCTNKLLNIWRYDGGIYDRLLNNFKHFYKKY